MGAAEDTDEQSKGVDFFDSENTGFIHFREFIIVIYPLGALRRSWGDERRGIFRTALLAANTIPSSRLAQLNFSWHLSVYIQHGSDIGTSTS